MKEIKRHCQSRRDFRADYECQACGHIDKNVCWYDDTYFNVTVVNEMVCEECKESNNSLNIKPPDTTIVAAHVVI